MDSYNAHRQPPDPALSKRHITSQQHLRPQLSTTNLSTHPQQQLPSFKEILPPPLHSAIDARSRSRASSYATQAAVHSGDLAHPSQSRATASGLPSPNQSHSSSMPDSFDEFGQRHQDTLYQVSQQQRQPSSWSSNNQAADMATSYAQRPAYQSQQMSMSRTSPGLPPIRDMHFDQRFDKMNNYDNAYPLGSMSYNSVYSQQGMGQNDNGAYGIRRSSLFIGEPKYSATYPPTTPRYPSQPEVYRNGAGNSYDYSRPQAYPGAYADYSNGGYTSSPVSAVPGNMYPQAGPSMMDSADGRNRRRRGNLPKQVTDILRQWFQDHLDHPYPSEEEKQTFIHQTGLSMNQISNWFINARRRHLPALRSARDKENQAALGEQQRSSR